jgi:hypothetical protein
VLSLHVLSSESWGNCRGKEAPRGTSTQNFDIGSRMVNIYFPEKKMKALSSGF